MRPDNESNSPVDLRTVDYLIRLLRHEVNRLLGMMQEYHPV
jgi:hypothetical protein